MKYQHLSIEEREKIQLGLWEKRSIRSIAKDLQRSPSAVSREISRNLPPELHRYAPRLANERAMANRKIRGRTERLKNDIIRNYVISHLKRRWSPEQIANKMRIDLGEAISHEAIYQFIYAQIYQNGWGYLKPGHEDLRPYLRFRRKRRARKGMRNPQKCRYERGLSIKQRPVIVEERARIGDWEGDTVVSKNHRPGLNTLVERKTGLVLMTKLSDNTGIATADAVEKRLGPMPIRLRHTLTLDNGPENSRWRQIEQAVGITCFFANPYHSWERGTNENTNGLIRDYFPKKTDFTMISETELAFVESELNNRPRKRLGWLTPLEVMSVALQS